MTPPLVPPTMRDYLWLLGKCFVGVFALAAGIVFVFSPLLLGIYLDGETASALWLLGLFVTVPIALFLLVVFTA